MAKRIPKLTKHQRLEKTRLEAIEMIKAGKRPTEVARLLDVSFRSICLWRRAVEVGGEAALKSRGKPGPSPQITDDQRSVLKNALVAGAISAGYDNQLWTLKRVQAYIRKTSGIKLSIPTIFYLLRNMGFSSQKPQKRARERDPQKVQEWKDQKWPAIREKAEAEGRTIVFVDESGISQKPARVATWAPVGETPVIEFNFNWKKLSAIAGVSFNSFWFALHEGSIKSEQIIAFVDQLRKKIDKKVLLVWDGLRAHWSGDVRRHIESLGDEVHVEQLPAYSPDLNPVEFLWGHLKQHELANFCATSLGILSKKTRDVLRKTQKRPSIIKAFWIQAELPLGI